MRATTLTSRAPSGDAVQFYDNVEPGLKDGTYRIDLSLELSAAGAEIPPTTQRFEVRGPRFSIDPADIHAVFPPNGATGVFEEVLPHVVFNKRLLPWERDVPSLADHVPWLALLVFSEGELSGPSESGNHARTITVEQLLAPETNTRKPRLDPATVAPAEQGQRCQTVTCASALFAQIVPNARELPYLAHVREVKGGGTAEPAHNDRGWFSVVVANRFAKAGSDVAASKSIVHLVSLEGFGDLLGDATPQAPAEPTIQLVTLANWTFSCLADRAQTFGGLARNLAFDPASGDARRPAPSLLHRLPFTPTGRTDAGTLAAEQRVAAGYVALGYHAPSGEDGFAWYRGPCSPVVARPVAGAGAFETADAATIYDAASGVFDLSLATAWQAGRGLALADRTFSNALRRVRIAADATLQEAVGISAADVQGQLAALIGGGALSTIAQASRSLAPLAASPRRRASGPSSAAALVRGALGQPDARARLAEQVEANPDVRTVADWLGQVLLLRKLPFVHLVPDARMLPAESIRFFYLDPNWQQAMLSGALSVGLGSSRQSAVQSALTVQLERMAQASALTSRSTPTGQPAPPPGAGGPKAGFLLRSSLVGGWPGLTVGASLAGDTVRPLRLERLGLGVLIALFDGTPDQIVIGEPHEGLAFGVDDAGAVVSRTLHDGEVAQGASVPVFDPTQPERSSATIRPGGQRVLNIAADPAPPAGSSAEPADLVGRLAEVLDIAPAALTPANFAVQMVKGPEQLVFSLQPQATSS